MTFRSLAATGLVLGVLAGAPQPGLAAPMDYAGTWTLNANGRIFLLEVEKHGRAFRGVMRPRRGAGPVTRIHGTIGPHGAVEFVRDTGPRGPDASDEVYRGYLMDGGRQTNAMAGTYSAHRNGAQRFGWYAERK